MEHGIGVPGEAAAAIGFTESDGCRDNMVGVRGDGEATEGWGEVLGDAAIICCAE